MTSKFHNRDMAQELHDALCQALIDKVASGEASAADLSVVRQFLKDNDIQALKTPNSPIGNLANIVEFPR